MDTTPPPRRKPRHPVHLFPLQVLLIVPIILAILTGTTLFLHSDTDIAMLYSQCHARSRLPWLSHIPVLGAPSCFLVSFFQEALGHGTGATAVSLRAIATLATVLSFVAGLLTISTVEAARVCNRPSWPIAYPTGAWLVFNLMGGALVWELVIVPAFFHRARRVVIARRSGSAVMEGAEATDPDFGSARRHLGVVAEVVAIPVAVAVGYVVPSAVMLAVRDPAAIVVWLFFPVWVSLVRQAVRAVVHRVRGDADDASFDLESDRLALVGVYSLPILCSVVAHVVLLLDVFVGPDDRMEMTRATLKFVEIDIFYIGLTVLYWLLVEAGWRVVLVALAASVILGPGAGICVGWVYRESMVDVDRSVTAIAVGSRRDDNGEPTENTPLLSE